MPFREWADKWFAARVVRATTHAGDLGRYRTHLLPAFGDVELKDLTPLRIKTFVAQLSAKRKPATVRHVHALLSTILNDAVAEGLLLTNPCRFSRLPRAPRYDAVYLSPRRALRHTHAAMLISSGVPMKAIQERLGHSSIVMTMDRYGHLLADVDDALLAVLDQRLPG